MSFTFNWPRFSDQFHYDAIQMLNTALNKGNKPPIIADKIEVVELEMGSQPPELEIRDIGDLTVDQFRGIFRLTYAGDAHLVLKTKVQANPLNHKQPDIHLMAGSRGMLAAKDPLVVPMLLRLSHFRLSSYVVLVVSKQKGITLVFKTDPLQNVDINSTFDSIAVIQNFIQHEIEGQLRQMFREDLPGIIHRLSQQWVKAKVEAPYLKQQRPQPQLQSRSLQHNHPSPPPSIASSLRPRSTSIASTSRLSSSRSKPKHKPSSLAPATTPNTHPQPHPLDHVSFPDLENFDPTYGLRPEGLPTKSGFRAFSSMFQPNKGLADLAEEAGSVTYDDDDVSDDASEDDSASADGEDGDTRDASFDFVDWSDTPPPPAPVPPPTEYETIPAIGGGTITRPRILHAQSSTGSGGPSRSSTSLPLRPPSSLHHIHPHHIQGASYFPELPPSRYAHLATAATHKATRSDGTSSSGRRHHQLPTPPPDAGYWYRGSSGEDGVYYRGEGSEYYNYNNDQDNDDTSIYMRPRRLSITSSASGSSVFPRPIASSSRVPMSSSSTHHHNPNHAPPSSPSNPSFSLSPPDINNGNNNATNNAINFNPNSNLTLADPQLILRANSVRQLSTLSYSNHTLSPYTRALSHFTVRSVPPRGGGGSGVGFNNNGFGFGGLGVGAGPVKARRKRMYRLGARKGVTGTPTVGGAQADTPADHHRDTSQAQTQSRSQTQEDTHARSKRRSNTNGNVDGRDDDGDYASPSEFDAADMDRYFRAEGEDARGRVRRRFGAR